MFLRKIIFQEMALLFVVNDDFVESILKFVYTKSF